MSILAPVFKKKCPGGGMVDTVDSKSAARKGVRVQVPPGVQNGGHLATFFIAINSKNISNLHILTALCVSSVICHYFAFFPQIFPQISPKNQK